MNKAIDFNRYWGFVGTITMIQFSYILSEYLKLTNEEMDKIIKEMEIGSADKIKCLDFINFIFGKSGKGTNV